MSNKLFKLTISIEMDLKQSIEELSKLADKMVLMALMNHQYRPRDDSPDCCRLCGYTSTADRHEYAQERLI